MGWDDFRAVMSNLAVVELEGAMLNDEKEPALGEPALEEPSKNGWGCVAIGEMEGFLTEPTAPSWGYTSEQHYDSPSLWGFLFGL